MKTILLALVLLAGGAQAQLPDAYFTRGLVDALNGRYWMSIGKNNRIDYLVGFGEAVGWYSAMGATDQVLHDKNADNWPTGATAGDIEKGVTKFYEEPENLSIPIINAIKIFAMKLHSRPQPAIDSEITFQRKLALFFDGLKK